MLDTSHLLNILCVDVGSETGQIELHNFRLAVSTLCVPRHGIVASNWIVRSKESLLCSLGLSTTDVVSGGCSRWRVVVLRTNIADRSVE